ncbi:MAG: helix-turn-helix transcriptional regulator [Solirubrobacteraceae bacterium]
MSPAELARYEAGLSVAAAAERSGVGARTIRRIENNDVAKPSAPVLKALADTYGVTVASLLRAPVVGAAEL